MKVTKEKRAKSPATPEAIYKIMMYMTFGVAGIFFLKNLLGGAMGSALVVGGCLAMFAIVVFGMKKLKMSQEKQQLAICICLVFLVFVISMNSGDFYSDDFPLFLAVIALSGLYLQPLYPLYQGVLATVLLIVLYVIHPEKADPLGQYIMCLVIFDLTAFLLYLLIKRGRAYIELSNVRAEEAEQLINSIRQVGEELNANYEQSSGRIAGMEEVNDHLAENVLALQRGSEEVTAGTKDVDSVCVDAMEQVQVTKHQVEALNGELRVVEGALEDNRCNIVAMAERMQKVKSEISEVTIVFSKLQEQIGEISGVTEQLAGIAASTKMLALNASIEAARAGETGKGFAVVASKVQDLAVDSNNCSAEVVGIVGQMQEQIDETSKELIESVAAIEESLNALEGLEQGFGGLNEKFVSLYEDIEDHNENVKNIDGIFGKLRTQIQDMGESAKVNQEMVDDIVAVTESYRNYVGNIVNDTRQIHELSASMLESVE